MGAGASLPNSDRAVPRWRSDEHLSRDLGIEELAAQLRLSPSHFTRLFKASTGLAPYRYLNELRGGRALGAAVEVNS